jgi:hypothetical protein
MASIKPQRSVMAAVMPEKLSSASGVTKASTCLGGSVPAAASG